MTSTIFPAFFRWRFQFLAKETHTDQHAVPLLLWSCDLAPIARKPVSWYFCRPHSSRLPAVAQLWRGGRRRPYCLHFSYSATILKFNRRQSKN
ncbi:hypothetical protein GHT06_012131 [Daphnia sinensis]|uniref:Uncharacterized protein n=1 Tax=Daphnia sinensis TaxID=1820382 RepID=A0AAD5LEC2_9CRUS|nr:hypothetical protein GHT06_012131 [Daphnia sinensis]